MRTVEYTESECTLLRDILCDTMLLATYTPGLVARNPHVAETLKSLITKVKATGESNGNQR